MRTKLLRTITVISLMIFMGLSQSVFAMGKSSQTNSSQQQAQQAMSKRIPAKVQKIQTALHAKMQRGEDVTPLVKAMQQAGRFMDAGQPEKAEPIMDKLLARLGGSNVPLNVPETAPENTPTNSSQDLCGHRGSTVVTSNMVIRKNCEVRGNLLIKGNAVLEVDYDSSAKSSFVVHGNVTLKDDAVLRVHGTEKDVFIIQNTTHEQYKLRSENRSVFDFKGVEFRTQKKGGKLKSLYMSYDALNSSRMILDNVVLYNKECWVLGNFKNSSSLKSVDTRSLPTEIYIHDASTIDISGPKSATGLWLGAGVMTGEISLPNILEKFNWEAGKGAGLNVDWHLKVTNANVGLALNSYPGSDITVNGQGRFGELTVGYYVTGGTETLENLKVGVQNGRVSDRLTLNNVHLGPIAWQIYVGGNEMLTIKNSVVNEIGFFKKGHVRVVDSTLQLAVLGLRAPGSTLDVRNTEIWSSDIEIGPKSELSIQDSVIYGSLFRMQSPESKVTITGGSFQKNPGSCNENIMVDFETGQPKCNPFRNPGFPEITGPGQFVCTGTLNCKRS